MELAKILLIFTSAAGFLLTLYIACKKHAHEKMVCPIGGKCEQVMHTEYARFFGIPLEWLGLTYYAVLFVLYTSSFIVADISHPLVRLLLIVFTMCGFLFSAYLTFIQGFTLKEWCTLCLASAALCTIILISSLAGADSSLLGALAGQGRVITAVQLVFFAVGLGVATMGDIFFLKFLKDFRISEWEHGVLNTCAQMMWFALAGIVVTTVGVSIIDFYQGVITPATSVSWVALILIIINGALLNLLVAPRLLHISFREKHDHQPGELHAAQRLAFISGALSFVSWYTAFILTIVPDLPLSTEYLLVLYYLLLVCAGCAGRGLEYVLLKNRPAAT
jgi:uncharacterized membrane protein